MSAAATPADLTITPRDVKLGDLKVAGLSPADAPSSSHPHAGRWWCGGNPVATAFFNALSAAFPRGETFFIEAVRRYREQVDPTLKAQIAAFVQQESMHTREHAVFNHLIKTGGYDTSTMDAETRRRIDIARSRPAIVQLGITVALEHFTAIMAHALLTDRNPLPGAPAEVVRLWQWHAIEEVEHKAVAYDTFLAATAGMSGFRRWMLRCHVMWLISLQFWYSNFQRMADFFRQDGINTPGTWLRVAEYLLVKPGMLRKIFLPWLAYFRPGFHPWNHDDRGLIAAIERGLAASR